MLTENPLLKMCYEEPVVLAVAPNNSPYIEEQLDVVYKSSGRVVDASKLLRAFSENSNSFINSKITSEVYKKILTGDQKLYKEYFFKEESIAAQRAGKILQELSQFSDLLISREDGGLRQRYDINKDLLSKMMAYRNDSIKKISEQQEKIFYGDREIISGLFKQLIEKENELRNSEKDNRSRKYYHLDLIVNDISNALSVNEETLIESLDALSNVVGVLSLVLKRGENKYAVNGLQIFSIQDVMLKEKY